MGIWRAFLRAYYSDFGEDADHLSKMKWRDRSQFLLDRWREQSAPTMEPESHTVAPRSAEHKALLPKEDMKALQTLIGGVRDLSGAEVALEILRHETEAAHALVVERGDDKEVRIRAATINRKALLGATMLEAFVLSERWRMRQDTCQPELDQLFARFESLDINAEIQKISGG